MTRSTPASASAGDLTHADASAALASPEVLIVPGLRNSGAAHWQTLWQEQNPLFQRLTLLDWDTPDLDTWASAVANATAGASAPPIVVAHSFGCLAMLRAAISQGVRIAAALVVAPADPDRFDATPLLPRGLLPFPTILVASTNDPWLKFLKAGALATRWGSRFIGYRNAGHINADSGFGPWQAGLELLSQLARSVAMEGTANAGGAYRFAA